MRTLVVSGSRHGATRGIAEAIADELRARGLDADLFEAQAAGNLDDCDQYGAVVAGSAVYMGHWLPESSRFVEKHSTFLATVPVWLFSSGPAGSAENAPHATPEGISKLIESTHAREHRVFSGRLERKRLGFGERLICKVVRAPDGDFRDWDAIRGWARNIAASLKAGQTPSLAGQEAR